MVWVQVFEYCSFFWSLWAPLIESIAGLVRLHLSIVFLIIAARGVIAKLCIDVLRPFLSLVLGSHDLSIDVALHVLDLGQVFGVCGRG